MASYVVQVDNFAPGSKGATVTLDELGGCNIDALLACGVLVEVAPAPSSSTVTQNAPTVPTGGTPVVAPTPPSSDPTTAATAASQGA